MANKNKPKREKKKRRLKHPELGRSNTSTSSRGFSQPSSRKKKPKVCDKCSRKFLNYLFVGGRVIKNVCGCNEYLLENEVNRIQEKRELKKSIVV